MAKLWNIGKWQEFSFIKKHFEIVVCTYCLHFIAPHLFLRHRCIISDHTAFLWLPSSPFLRILYHPICWPFHNPQDSWSLYSIQNCGLSSLFLCLSFSLYFFFFPPLKYPLPLTLIMFNFPGPLLPYNFFLSFLFTGSSFSFSILLLSFSNWKYYLSTPIA